MKVAIWLLVAVLGALLLSFDTSPTEDIVYQSPLGDLLPARLYRPRGDSPYPVVLCVHSFWQTQANAEAQALDFARNGYMAVTSPLQPYSEIAHRKRDTADFVADLEALCKVLRYRRDVRQDAIFALGHSMGADLACSLARTDPQIRGTLCLGFPVDAEPGNPHNLLISVGAWDELHPLAEMQAVLAQASDGSNPPLSTGLARMLYVQPAADHFMEIYDADFMRQAIGWMDTTLGRPAVPPVLHIWRDSIAIVMVFCGVAAAALSLPWRPILVAMAGGLALGLVYRTDPRPLWHLLILSLAVGAMAAPLQGRAVGRRTVANLAVLQLMVMAVFLLNGWTPIRTGGARALLFFVWFVPFHLRELLLEADQVLFHQTPGTTGLSPWLVLLWLVELAWPGRIVGRAVAAFNALVSHIQGLHLKVTFDISRTQLGLLLGLAVAALLTWRQTLAAGYSLDAADATRLLSNLARFVVVPLLLAPWLLRSSVYRRWYGG